MSDASTYTILSSYLEEVDEAAGYWDEFGTPKRLIWHQRYEQFEPQDSNRATVWQDQEAIIEMLAPPVPPSSATLTVILPNPATVGGPMLVEGTGLTHIVTLDYDDGQGNTAHTTAFTSQTDTEIDANIPDTLPPGTYQVTGRGMMGRQTNSLTDIILAAPPPSF